MSHNIYSEEPKPLKYLIKIIRYNPKNYLYFEIYFANTFKEACDIAKLEQGILGKSIMIKKGKNKYIRKEGLYKEFIKRTRKKREERGIKCNI